MTTLIALGVPATASAYMVQPICDPGPCRPVTHIQTAVSATYKGWAYVRMYNVDCALYRTSILSCPVFVMAPTHSAWKWTGTAWVSKPRPDGQRIYAWPWTSTWTWTWTEASGWRAMHRTDVVKVSTYYGTLL
jgi:hypothetical protein